MLPGTSYLWATNFPADPRRALMASSGVGAGGREFRMRRAVASPCFQCSQDVRFGHDSQEFASGRNHHHDVLLPWPHKNSQGFLYITVRCNPLHILLGHALCDAVEQALAIETA